MTFRTASRVATLDFVKGICTILVIMNHCAWNDEQRQQMLFPWWVDTAVPVFMLISGYVYELSCQKKQIRDLSQAYNPAWILGKAIRLTLPVIIIYFVTLLWDLAKHGTITYPILDTFLQGGRGPGSYYYPVMLQFVLVVPVIRHLINKYAHKGLLLCLAINILFDILRVAYCMPVECYRFMVLRYTFVIACGSYLASGFPVKVRYSVISFCVGCAFLCAYLYLGYEPHYLADWTVTSFLASMYCVPIVSAIIKNANLHLKPIILLGRASYNIFLVQMLYFYALAPILYKAVTNIWLQAGCNFIICLSGGVGFYLLESPATFRIRRYISAAVTKHDNSLNS